MPIERQCARFARVGVDGAPPTLVRRVSAAIDLLAPVARLIDELTRGPGLLGTDAACGGQKLIGRPFPGAVAS